MWAEVYEQAEQLLPHVHTGAFFSGYYVAANAGKIKMAFEDTRGGNPPFGKIEMDDLEPHYLYFMPSYAQNFLTTHMVNKSTVLWHFCVYPLEGYCFLFFENFCLFLYCF